MEEHFADLPCPSCQVINLSCRVQCWKCGACLVPGHYIGADGRAYPLATSKDIKKLLDQATVFSVETPPTSLFPRLRLWARKQDDPASSV